MLRKIVALVGVLLAFSCSAPAYAQTALQAPSIKWGGVWGTTQPQSLIGYDSGTGLPCIVGSTGTCSLPTTGGGGGGGGAVYGPTANGSAAANPPVLMGGTANGTGTGNVTNWKIDTSGLGYVSVGAALPAGSNTIGAVTQASGPWTVSWSGQTVAATEADGANVALGSKADAATCAITNTALACLRQLHADLVAALPAGANVIGGVTQSGTWTVQPGNTANTTPWLFTINQGGNAATVSAGGALKVDGSASTQPVSGTVSVNLNAGSNLIGKVGIDQTNPGTTNGVTVTDGTNSASVAASGVDGASNALAGLRVYNRAFTYNGTTWDRVYSLGATGTSATGVQAVGPIGQFNTTLPTLTTGQYGGLQLNTKGMLLAQVGDASGSVVALVNRAADGGSTGTITAPVTSSGFIYNGSTWDRQRSIQGAASANTGIGVSAVEEGGRPYTHISANATTTAKSGAGFLHTVCINSKGAAANTATIYDSATGSGTVIAVLDTTGNVGCMTYDLAFSTGLTIVTATGTAPDLTVTTR